MDLAISSESLITVDDCVPGAGVSSKRVTIGPCLTSVISPLILKSLSTLVNNDLLMSVLRPFSASVLVSFWVSQAILTKEN